MQSLSAMQRVKQVINEPSLNSKTFRRKFCSKIKTQTSQMTIIKVSFPKSVSRYATLNQACKRQSNLWQKQEKQIRTLQGTFCLPSTLLGALKLPKQPKRANLSTGSSRRQRPSLTIKCAKRSLRKVICSLSSRNPQLIKANETPT